MKRSMKSLLACAVLFGLSACGSGSANQPSVSTPAQPGVSQPGANNSGAGQSGTSQSGNQGENSENAMALMATGAENSVKNPEATVIKRLGKDSVMVNGHVIALVNPSIQSSELTSLDTKGDKHTITSGDKFSHTHFGYLYVYKESGHYVFAVGDVTPTSGTGAVPSTGKAVYEGNATFNGFFRDNSSSFDVDFGAKTITGKAQAEDLTVPLSGKINGNSFMGAKDNVTMQGQFFGPNAAELGGTFKGKIPNHKGESISVIGSFGAIKQK